MNKRIVLILLCGFIFLIITGCGDVKVIEDTGNSEKKEEEKKNYYLEEICSDCKLDNITFIGDKYVVSNNAVYVYSNKLYSESNTHCKKIIDDFSTYNYLGKIYWYDINNPDTFTNGKDVVIVNEKKENGYVVINKDDKSYNTFLKEYNNNDMYYYFNGNELSDKKITVYSPSEENYILEVPSDEKIAYILYNPTFNGIITDKNAYSIDIDKNDKCYKYEDIKCEYKLIKTDKYDELLNDFKGKIDFFDGIYLATKEGKMYTVRFNN